MLRASDCDGGSENALEHFELCTAQGATRHGSVADGAMVFDQDEVVAVGTDLGKVALVGSHVGQSLHSIAEADRAFKNGRVLRYLPVGPGIDHLLERRVAQRRAHRIDQVDAELAVPIGEGLCRRRSELPMHWRTPASCGLGHRAADHSGILERVQMLAQCRIGEPEFSRQIRCRCGLDAFQPLDDPALGVGVLGHPGNSTGADPFSEALPCIIDARGDWRPLGREAMRGEPAGFDKMFRS